MKVTTYLLDSKVPNTGRYLISDKGPVTVNIPDLCFKRYYTTGDKFVSESIDYYIPELYSTVEYDTYTKRFYIVKYI